MKAPVATVVAMAFVLAWGAFAFGAVYDWGQWSLAAGILLLAAWRCRPGGSIRSSWRGLEAVAFAAVVVAVAAQLVPLSGSLLERLSPATVETLAATDISFVNTDAPVHALSIAPARTQRALVFLLLMALWTATCASVLRHRGMPTLLARAILFVGVSLAVVGLAQDATFKGKLLWFWTPVYWAYNSFGPFVNRNHFAGWMVLAIGVGLGYMFGASMSVRWREARDFRARVLLLESVPMREGLLAFLAVAVMACATVWTMSRSGIGAMIFVMAVMISAVFVRAGRAGRRFSQVALLAIVVAIASGVVWWRGLDDVVERYSSTATLEWRFQLWADTMPILREFWATGSGLNSYRLLMAVYPRTDRTVWPYEAHNDYLQLATEGGALVVVPVLLLLAALGRSIWRALKTPQDDRSWWLRFGAAAGIFGMLIQETVEFSLQIPGVALLCATCLGLAFHQKAPREEPRSRRQAREPFGGDTVSGRGRSGIRIVSSAS